MEKGFRITWGRLVPGREQQALDTFADVMTYFGKKMADGKVTYFEPFFVRTGDFEEELGFMIIKGPAQEITQILEEEDYLTLLDKGFYVVSHLKVDYLTVGDGIGEQIARGAKTRELLKI